MVDGGPGLTSTVAATVVSLAVVPRSLPPTAAGSVAVDVALASFWSGTCVLVPELSANSLSVELVPSAFLRAAQTLPRALS